jgi:hypothetical protein
VEGALTGALASDLDLLAAHARLPGDHPLITQASMSLGVPANPLSENAVAGLLRWLASPVAGADEVGLGRMQAKAAMFVARLVTAPGSPDQTMATQALQITGNALPEGSHEIPSGMAAALSRQPEDPAACCYAWPRSFLLGRFEEGFGAVRLSPELAASSDALKRAWREWLALYNQLQVLPSMYLLEASGVQHGDYGALGARSGAATPPDSNGPAWQQALSLALGEFQPGMLRLQQAGTPAPDEVGFELGTDGGGVLAEAELAWLERRLVVLAEHQLGMAEIWKTAGWIVVDGCKPDWAERVLEQEQELAGGME